MKSKLFIPTLLAVSLIGAVISAVESAPDCHDSCNLLTNDSLACDELNSDDLAACNELYPKVKFVHLNWYQLLSDGDDYRRKSLYNFKRLTDIFLEPGGLAREVMEGSKKVHKDEWLTFSAIELYKGIKVHLYMRLLEGNCCTRLNNVKVLNTLLKKSDVDSLFDNCPEDSIKDCLETNDDEATRVEKLLTKALKNETLFSKFCSRDVKGILKRDKRNRRSDHYWREKHFRRKVRAPPATPATRIVPLNITLSHLTEDVIRQQLFTYQVISIVSVSALLITFIVVIIYCALSRGSDESYNESNRRSNINQHHKEAIFQKLNNSASADASKSEDIDDLIVDDEPKSKDEPLTRKRFPDDHKLTRIMKMIGSKIKFSSTNNIRDDGEKQKLVQSQPACLNTLGANNNSFVGPEKMDNNDINDNNSANARTIRTRGGDGQQSLFIYNDDDDDDDFEIPQTLKDKAEEIERIFLDRLYQTSKRFGK